MARDVCRVSPLLFSALVLISWSMSLNLCLCDDFEEDFEEDLEEDLEEAFDSGLADPFEDGWERSSDDECDDDLDFFELLLAEVECSDKSPMRDLDLLIRL